MKKVLSVEEHVTSIVLGFQGYIDLVFEADVIRNLGTSEETTTTETILFEIKTGRITSNHEKQVWQNFLLLN